ncbi:hypothetical protein [Flavobacterium sp.]|uniref:hypothetical protein n=1 Tax=Flavobacterium sp. TaxID=239 RepID=UPI00121CB239|nr:hypothetical protein [Flavobacterium sp.]RZJ69338.1 MAG: hypothetical protein EOO49_17715 [Flavobacterium sp.]
MNKVSDFIRKNYIVLGVASCFFVYYVYSTVAGNRICDCEKTEKYSSTTTRAGVNRFYHK